MSINRMDYTNITKNLETGISWAESNFSPDISPPPVLVEVPEYQSFGPEICSKLFDFPELIHLFSIINKIGTQNTEIEELVIKAYKRRKITPVMDFLKTKEAEIEAVYHGDRERILKEKKRFINPISTEYINEFLDFFKSIHSCLTKQTGFISSILFETSRYEIPCDSLLKKLSTLLHKCLTLQNIIMHKSLRDDFSKINEHLFDDRIKVESSGVWNGLINEKNFEQMLLDAIAGVGKNNLTNFLNLIVEFLLDRLGVGKSKDECNFIRSELRDSYIVALSLLHGHTNSKGMFRRDKYADDLKRLVEKYPYVTYCLDVFGETSSLFGMTTTVKCDTEKYFSSLMAKAQSSYSSFRDVLDEILLSERNKGYDEDDLKSFYNYFTSYLSHMSSLRHFVGCSFERYRLTNYMGENNVDFRLDDYLAESYLGFISFGCAGRDYIHKNFSIIRRLVNMHLVNVLNECRELFSKNMDNNNSFLSMIQLLPKGNVESLIPPVVVDVIRITIQLCKDKQKKRKVESFISKSRLYEEMYNLSATIEDVFDLSQLYFREVSITRNPEYSKKITLNLPYLLSKYSYTRTNKTKSVNASVYLPLFIYDSAAKKAITYFKSYPLYEEIRVEAGFVTRSIMEHFVSDSLLTIYHFVMLNPVNGRVNLNNISYFKSATSVIECGNVFGYDKMFLMGCNIRAKSLMSKWINGLLSQEFISRAIAMKRRHGLAVMTFFDKYMRRLKDIHSLICTFRISLEPFADMFNNEIKGVIFSNKNSQYHGLIDSELKILIHEFYLTTTYDEEAFIPKRKESIKTKSMRILKSMRIGDEENSSKSGKTNVLMENVIKVYKLDDTKVNVNSFRLLFNYLSPEIVVSLVDEFFIETINSSFESFITSYTTIKNSLVGARVGDPSLSDGLLHVYRRYHSAYQPFIGDIEVEKVFTSLSHIGAVIAASNMIDQALALRNISANQFFSYFMSLANGIDKRSMSEDLISFLGSFQREIVLMKENDAPNPTAQKLIHHVCSLFKANYNMFVFTTQLAACYAMEADLLKDLDGFSSIWSVLEFLFCYNESMARNNSEGFKIYGFALTYPVSIILSMTKQERIYRALSIAKIVRFYSINESADAVNEEVSDFVDVYDDVERFMNISKAFVSPFVNKVI